MSILSDFARAKNRGFHLTKFTVRNNPLSHNGNWLASQSGVSNLNNFLDFLEILRSSMARVALERDELKTKIQILENDNFNFVIFNLATISLCAALLFWTKSKS